MASNRIYIPGIKFAVFIAAVAPIACTTSKATFEIVLYCYLIPPLIYLAIQVAMNKAVGVAKDWAFWVFTFMCCCGLAVSLLADNDPNANIEIVMLPYLGAGVLLAGLIVQSNYKNTSNRSSEENKTASLNRKLFKQIFRLKPRR